MTDLGYLSLTDLSLITVWLIAKNALNFNCHTNLTQDNRPI